ncbi:MAG: hypothetical protein CSA49_04220 [Gammaproteobacteria bacterium]|nr:MAG: hypothetical protein CSA49_04220 [Gammaproteobacteria bacterium]
MKLTHILAATALTAVSGSALALPTLDTILGTGPSLTSSGSEYFNLVDTDGNSDDFFATIVLEQAAYESNMGIYEFTTDAAGNVTVTDSLQIFSASNEPGILTGSQTVNFDLANGIAFLDDDGVFGYSAGDSQATIDGSFGFYLNVVNTGHTYYSHNSLNADGFDHLAVFETLGQGGATNSFDLVLAWEDLNNGGDQDYTDMVIVANDIAVSEPATFLMLGLGLVGLGFARKKRA